MPKITKAKPRQPAVVPESTQFAYDAGELYNEPDPEWLLPGFFPIGGVTVVYAPTSTGKSQVVTAIAGGVAREHVWGGHRFKSGLAFTVVCENWMNVKFRYRAWLRLNNEPEADFDATTWFNGEVEPRFNLLTGLDALDKKITEIVEKKERPARLLVIDHRGRAMRGAGARGPNAAEIVMTELERLGKKHGMAIILITHTVKSGEHISGPAEYVNWAAASYRIAQSPDPEHQQVYLIGEKQREGLPSSMTFVRSSVMISPEVSTAALIFQSFEGMPSEEAKRQDLARQIAVKMETGQTLSLSQVAVLIGIGEGGNQRALVRQAVPSEWLTIELPGIAGKALRRERKGSRDLIVCVAAEDTQPMYPINGDEPNDDNR